MSKFPQFSVLAWRRTVVVIDMLTLGFVLLVVYFQVRIMIWAGSPNPIIIAETIFVICLFRYGFRKIATDKLNEAREKKSANQSVVDNA